MSVHEFHYENNMLFADLQLNTKILKAIHTCGYKAATPVQQQAIPSILAGKDVIACAQTGTGKTAAFILPALEKLTSQQNKKTRILILTPTRELAKQVTDSALTYGKFLNFNIANLVGGVAYYQQIRQLSRGAEMIVATPGRLLDHMQQKRIDLSCLDILVLDEADRMLDMGFIEDVERIAKSAPTKRQTLLFSATISKELNHFIQKQMREPQRIDVSPEKIAAPQIKQEFCRMQSQQQKFSHLITLLKQPIYKAIVFVATKINTEKLAKSLREQGYLAAALHGDLKQNVRYRTIEQLKKGAIQVLVATDVAARGIDTDISHVINYDLPRFCEDYVHRIGRTGRAGKSGTAISFVLPADQKHLHRIERFLGKRFNNAAEKSNNAQTALGTKEQKPFAKKKYATKKWQKPKKSATNKRSRFTPQNDQLIRPKKQRKFHSAKNTKHVAL